MRESLKSPAVEMVFNELERARGITIKSAVAAFRLNDLEIHQIDTPTMPISLVGHRHWWRKL